MNSKAIYPCLKCNRTFSLKHQLENHIALRKTECVDDTLEKLTYGTELVTCVFCETIFSNNSNLKRHYESTTNNCFKNKRKGYNITNFNNIQNIQNIKHIMQNVQQNVQNNQINIQPVKTVVLAKHGKETISHITKEIMLELLKLESFTKMSTELTRLLYFNDEVPENKNWTIVYPRNKKAGVELNYDTNKFERVLTEKVINYKFCNMIGLFLPMIETIDKEDQETHNLTWLQRSNLKKFTSYFGITNISKEAKYIYDSIKEMAYNERQKTMKTWKENGHEGNHLSLKF